MKYLVGFIAALVAGLFGSLLIALSGPFINVAATDPDSAMTEWFLRTAMRRSVVFQSSGIVPPGSFTEAQVKDGFGEFEEMCVGCHGAPGKKRNEIGKGLHPQAPDLAETARSWTSGNLFWIVKNGVKMTAMPAFGPTHDDATIWNIVAFLNRLPSTTPDQYARLKEENAGPEGKHEH